MKNWQFIFVNYWKSWRWKFFVFIPFKIEINWDKRDKTFALEICILNFGASLLCDYIPTGIKDG